LRNVFITASLIRRNPPSGHYRTAFTLL
jgi:hypothetical protein